jgi:hypothetical protein
MESADNLIVGGVSVFKRRKLRQAQDGVKASFIKMRSKR